MTARSWVGGIAVKVVDAATLAVAVVARRRLYDACECKGTENQRCASYCLHTHVPLLGCFDCDLGAKPGRPCDRPFGGGCLESRKRALATWRRVVSSRLLS